MKKRQEKDELLATVRKQPHDYLSNNEFLSSNIKTPPITPIQWLKGTILIAGDSMLHELAENTLRNKSDLSQSQDFCEKPLKIT